MKSEPIDKKLLKDTTGRPLTQSLFLELGYNTQYAVYTLNDEDKVYQGKVYPSLKRLYLEVADPFEHAFAKKHLLGWRHWKRLCENKLLVDHIAEWRDELEVMLKSEAMMAISDMPDNFQAMKFLAERGWEKARVGRPVKKDAEHDKLIEDRIEHELRDTLVRMDKTAVN